VTTEIANLHTTPGFGGARDVYVGRAGRGQSGYFGNPVVVGRECPICRVRHVSPGDTLRCHEIYLAERLLRDELFRLRVMDLSGRRLWCFCAPGPCHASTLARYADALSRGTHPGCLCRRGLTPQCRRCVVASTCECETCVVALRFAP